MFLLVTIIALCTTIFYLIKLTYHMSFNGDPADYYSSYRTLTKSELKGLKHQFPKEIFRPDIYLIDNETLMTESISTYGQTAGGFSYNKLGHLKVRICYLGTQDIISALNKSTNGNSRFLIVRGKSKNYVIDINGVNFFEEQKKSFTWFDCWQRGYNAEATAQRHIRICGQRQATKQERSALRKSYYQDYPPSAWVIGLLLFYPLLILLVFVNTNTIGSNLLSSCILIALGLVITYFFFIHLKIFPNDAYTINTVEGEINCSNSGLIILGDLSCYSSSPAMVNKLQESGLMGKVSSVEITPQDDFDLFEIVNVEGVTHINDYWQDRVPKAYYMFYFISALGSLVFSLWLFFYKIQYHPYSFAEYPTNTISFYILALYSLYGISYSVYFIIKNKATEKYLNH